MVIIQYVGLIIINIIIIRHSKGIVATMDPECELVLASYGGAANVVSDMIESGDNLNQMMPLFVRHMIVDESDNNTILYILS